MNDEKHDDNPWDEDDGARTLATDGPSFEMPSNIPSPITVPPPPPPLPPPPPPVSPKHPPKATLVGLMPEDFLASIAKGAPPRPGPGTPRSQPRPVTISDDALDDLHGQRNDGPTMLGAGSSPNIPLRDDAARPGGFAPAHRLNDADAETMALSIEDSRLPDLSDEPEAEDATRALTREEMMGTPPGGHQDAHVIVGSDARGDEATLAIGPDQLSPELGELGELGASLEPALAEALARRVAEHHQHVQQQAHQQGYPQPPHEPYAQQAPYVLPQPATRPVAYPPSGPHPVMGPQSHPFPQSQPQPWGAPPGYAPQPQAQPMMAPPGAQWMPPSPSPLPPPAAGGPSVFGIRLTSQIMVLAGVGVVCLAIFVVGLVLFFTTKF